MRNSNLHSCIQVRTWLQELLNMALLQGGFDSGFHMHDIIRQYCISRCSGLDQNRVNPTSD